jgi:hypothetical protein
MTGNSPHFFSTLHFVFLNSFESYEIVEIVVELIIIIIICCVYILVRNALTETSQSFFARLKSLLTMKQHRSPQTADPEITNISISNSLNLLSDLIEAFVLLLIK